MAVGLSISPVLFRAFCATLLAPPASSSWQQVHREGVMAWAGRGFEAVGGGGGWVGEWTRQGTVTRRQPRLGTRVAEFGRELTHLGSPGMDAGWEAAQPGVHSGGRTQQGSDARRQPRLGGEHQGSDTSQGGAHATPLQGQATRALHSKGGKYKPREGGNPPLQACAHGMLTRPSECSAALTEPCQKHSPRDGPSHARAEPRHLPPSHV